MAGLEPTRRFTGYYLFSRQVPYAIRVTSPNVYSNIAIIQRSATQAILTQGKIQTSDSLADIFEYLRRGWGSNPRVGY